MAHIRRILGSMTFGGPINEAQAHQLLKEWVKHGYAEVDTAIVYHEGKSERIMGKLHLCRDPQKIKIACKANPKKGFSAEQVIDQLNQSLAALQVSSVDIFYLHLPDHTIPIEETLKGVQKLYKEGKFKEFGLSNFASWEVIDIYHICKQNEYVVPTVYQGMYNALTRDIEVELIPSLRRYGIRFYCYNPLAGGLLTGKYDFSASEEYQPKGRFFASNTKGWANARTKSYMDRYWRESYKAGVTHVKKVLKETYGNDVSLLEASMRWLHHHSKLNDNDGIILGCSKPEHFQMNIDACNGDALHQNVVDAFDHAWDGIKSKCPKYNR
ncbi:aflatoxin B1 aldehyde reductase member 3-like [Hydractinia symbiolongicarpus]|uniref:aflatoxin B1 aldehyde reductase member 3-like n=1 Tax=Hydractinia symbiolongicarpus TaxID=13093 RepID=UPI00254AB247|nr:aflatoxin B1 aldehyde reductase member 3-like [Hydractinia symbiolongicarpus]XP_057294861.1 aflatoxin B1 aldehyde reductase member 3-like [Hydractinia symbiolongicarpus]